MPDYYTKEEVVKAPFIFLSYKHDDNSDFFEETVKSLFSAGVRFWYDADLHVGNEWDATAELLIKNQNCKGVVFFNSVEAFKSEPISKERHYALQKADICKKKGEEFLILPVNIGKDSTHRLLKAVYESLPDDNNEIDEKFPLESVKDICDLFGSNLIYSFVNLDNKENCIADLLDSIKQELGEVINKDYLYMKKVREGGSGDGKENSVNIGICTDKEVNEVPVYMLKSNQVITYNGETLLVKNGRAYTIKSIPWRLLNCKDDRLIYISEYILDFRHGTDLYDWLREFFSYSLDESEKKEIFEIRLLDEGDLKDIQGDSLVFSDFPDDGDGSWWIGPEKCGPLRKVIKKDGRVSSTPYNVRTKKSGVRPVIAVNQDYLVCLHKKQSTLKNNN